MAKKQEYGPGQEFFSEWHHDQYVTDLKRELQGAVNREDDAYADNVRDELKRLGEMPAQGLGKRGPGRPRKDETK